MIRDLVLNSIPQFDRLLLCHVLLEVLLVSAQAPGDADGSSCQAESYPTGWRVLMDSRNYEDLVGGSQPAWRSLDLDEQGQGVSMGVCVCGDTLGGYGCVVGLWVPYQGIFLSSPPPPSDWQCIIFSKRYYTPKTPLPPARTPIFPRSKYPYIENALH